MCVAASPVQQHFRYALIGATDRMTVCIARPSPLSELMQGIASLRRPPPRKLSLKGLAGLRALARGHNAVPLSAECLACASTTLRERFDCVSSTSHERFGCVWLLFSKRLASVSSASSERIEFVQGRSRAFLGCPNKFSDDPFMRKAFSHGLECFHLDVGYLISGPVL